MATPDNNSLVKIAITTSVLSIISIALTITGTWRYEVPILLSMAITVLNLIIFGASVVHELVNVKVVVITTKR